MEYPKIQSVFVRDPDDDKQLIAGEVREAAFALPCEWMLTEKIDGTNIRLVIDDGKRMIGGRTERAAIPTHLFQFLDEKFPAELLEAAFEPGTKAIVFGEGHGAKIQKGGGLYCDGPAFSVFDVAVFAGERVWWLDWDAVCDVAGKLTASTVPIIQAGASIDDAVGLIRGGLISKRAETARYVEGVVARTTPGLLMRNGKRLIWKLKGRDLGRPEGAL